MFLLLFITLYSIKLSYFYLLKKTMKCQLNTIILFVYRVPYTNFDFITLIFIYSTQHFSLNKNYLRKNTTNYYFSF